MSWARYDDELPMNQKIGKLRALGINGMAALGLHLLANTYCRHNGTKGIVEPHVPELLAGRCGIKLAGVLVDVGMFHILPDGGWEMNSYAEFHDPNDPEPDKSAADRKRELSEKRAAAGRLGGQAKASNAPSKPVAMLQQTSSPVPDPVPISRYISDDDDSVDTPLPPSSSSSDRKQSRNAIAIAAARTLAKNRTDLTNRKGWITRTADGLLRERLDDIDRCITNGYSMLASVELLTTQPLEVPGPGKQPWYADPHCLVCSGDGWWTDDNRTTLPCTCRQVDSYIATVTPIRPE